MTPTLVIDASVAVKWFVREEQSDEARRLAESGAKLVAPRLIGLEVAAALSKKARRKLVDPAVVDTCVDALPIFFDELIDDGALVRSAVSIALDLDHALYDCLYLEAARRREAVLVTSDLRFLGKAARGRQKTEIVALSDWEAAIR